MRFGLTLRGESLARHRAREQNLSVNTSVPRVAIVSPTEVVETGLTAMLTNHPERVEVVDLQVGFDAHDPDVILYDAAGLHHGDGDDLEHLVKETTSAVIVVTQDLRPDLGARALSRGADGFFSIEVDDAGLIAAVEAAAGGAPDGDAPDPKDFGARETRLGHDVGLTEREIDVLAMITRGLSNQEIAEQTYLSINSVKTYIRSAYRRIDVISRSQAVVWCIQHGFPAEGDG